MPESIISPTLTESSTSVWHDLAENILSGQSLTREQGLAILRSDDDDLLDLLSSAFRIRRHFFDKTVQLYFLMNAKSGICPEDCSYCSQAKDSKAEIPKYNLLSRDKLLDGAHIAHQHGAKTYCIVISARGPSDRELEAVSSIVPEIKQKFDLKICACLGLLTPEQARRLKECGVDRVNHNLNTSRNHYGEICSTHDYQDRLDTLHAVRSAGLEMCSGGITGMGEQDEDIVEMALELRDLGVHSIPINFLIPIEGAQISKPQNLNPRRCLKILALYRYANPDREIRIAGGREIHLGPLQPLGLYAANSIFVGDYLTTKGQPPESDYEMIKAMGFEITRHEEIAAPQK